MADCDNGGRQAPAACRRMNCRSANERADEMVPLGLANFLLEATCAAYRGTLHSGNCAEKSALEGWISLVRGSQRVTSKAA